MTSSVSPIAQSNGSNGLSEAFRGRGTGNGISFDDLVNQLSDQNSPITKAIEKAGNDAPFLEGLGVNVEDGIDEGEAEEISGRLEELQPQDDADPTKLSLDEFAQAYLGNGQPEAAQPAGGAPAPSGAAPAPAGGEAATSAEPGQFDEKIAAAAEEFGMEPEKLEQLLDKDGSGDVSEAEFKPLEDLLGEEFFADMGDEGSPANANAELKMLA